MNEKVSKVTLKALANGPLILDTDGRMTAICRCGLTTSKEGLCTGEHQKARTQLPAKLWLDYSVSACTCNHGPCENDMGCVA